MLYKGKISKSILRPYYHKVLEYKAIRGIALKVLKESDFFEKTGLSPDKIRISFGDDGTFPIWETPVFVNGVCIFRFNGPSIESSGQYNFRKCLTDEESYKFSDNLKFLFMGSHSKTIPAELGGRISYWGITENYCEFVVEETRFLNKDWGTEFPNVYEKELPKYKKEAFEKIEKVVNGLIIKAGFTPSNNPYYMNGKFKTILRYTDSSNQNNSGSTRSFVVSLGVEQCLVVNGRSVYCVNGFKCDLSEKEYRTIYKNIEILHRFAGEKGTTIESKTGKITSYYLSSDKTEFTGTFGHYSERGREYKEVK